MLSVSHSDHLCHRNQLFVIFEYIICLDTILLDTTMHYNYYYSNMLLNEAITTQLFVSQLFKEVITTQILFVCGTTDDYTVFLYFLAAPRYNPSSKTVFIGQPAYYDFGYSGSNPDYFRWYKNGKRYYGDFSKC